MSHTPKPSSLPSSFKPAVVEWKAIEMPAPQRGDAYVAAALSQKFSSQPTAGSRPKPPGLSRKKKPTIEARPEDTLVWICDSDARFLAQAEECLSAWGFRYASYSESESVMAALNEGSAPHVLIVGSDVGASRGVAIAQEFVARVPEIEVILVASPGELAFALEAKGTRMHELVLKPLIRTEDLRSALGNSCRRVHERVYTQFLVAEFDRYHRAMEIEARLAAELSEHVELSKTLKVGCQALSELFDDGGAIFFQYQPSQRSLVAAARYPQGIFAGAQPQLMVPQNVGADIAAVQNWLADLGGKSEFQAMMSQAAEMSPDLLTGFESVAWRTALVETRGIPRGVIAVLTHRWNEKTDSLRLQRIAQNLSKSFEIALLHSRLSESTIEDAFTGLANEKYLHRRLNEEIGKASRLKHPLSVLIFSKTDVANLASKKKSGRTQDKNLKHLAQLVKASFRSTDLIAFRGEDQFAVVLPHTSFVDALRKVEKFRDAVKLSAGDGWKLSGGVAEYPGHAATVEELLFAAEEACASAASAESFGIHIATVRPGYVPPFLPESPRSTWLRDRRNTDIPG